MHDGREQIVNIAYILFAFPKFQEVMLAPATVIQMYLKVMKNLSNVFIN